MRKMSVTADIPVVEGFESFITAAEPRLRHALVAAVGRELGREAAAEALAYGWENWDRVKLMENPVGYLYRVGRSRVRVRRRRIAFVPAPMHEAPVPGPSRIPDVEPGLPGALKRLSERQRICVFLVHGMDWTRREVSELLGISVNSVGSHLDRGLDKLRDGLGVNADG
jgi:DNA-directed RNA polymerase specialized sigma24 family protein